MKAFKPSAGETRLVESLVAEFKRDVNQSHLKRFLENLNRVFEDSSELGRFIHSVKWRVKDPHHLRDKLHRKLREAHEKGEAFEIGSNNLFEKVNDLAGFRLLHLHTRQMGAINNELKRIFKQEEFPLIEGPIAKIWDSETQSYFGEIGIECQTNPRMYTSVHYVIGSGAGKKTTCEIQVRTLSEEVWGEVDHKINYPYPAKSVACREQIKVLARVTSGCSRLVDSIFAAQEEERKLSGASLQPKKGKARKK